ncbi:MAG: glycosyltransferase [Phycisphaerae bacterium]|nr:glycosyltransferase [Phycisphaerae bacterium]
MNTLNTLQLVSVRWWNANAYYAISLTEALNQVGYYSIAGGRENSPPIRKAKQFNLPVFADIDLETFNPISGIKNVLRLKRFIQQNSIRLVNAHRAEDVFFGVLTKKLSPTPIPVIRSVGDVRPPKNHCLNRWIHERGTDYFIFSCRANYDRYQSVWPIFENKSEIIYSAIDTEFFQPRQQPSPLRKELSISDEEVVIGIIARLSPVKDHHRFLRAAAQVASQAPQARFLISGEEAQLSHVDLKEFARELGIYEKVIFMHRDDGLDIRDLIDCLDIGIVSSSGSEVICRVSVEFMAMGKPQVTTDINVLPEITEEGINGFVVPAKDPEAMAKRILELVNNPELRREMGKRARQVAETKYSFPVFAEKTLEVYRRVLDRHGV